MVSTTHIKTVILCRLALNAALNVEASPIYLDSLTKFLYPVAQNDSMASTSPAAVETVDTGRQVEKTRPRAYISRRLPVD